MLSRKSVATVLASARFEVDESKDSVVFFENDSVCGACFLFDTAADLLDSWQTCQQDFLIARGAALRKAHEKAWSVYLAFLTGEQATQAQQASLLEIEEDLSSTRKIVKDRVKDLADIKDALLPLLPLQNLLTVDALDDERRVESRLALPTRTSKAFFDRQEPERIVEILIDELRGEVAGESSEDKVD